MTRLLLARHAQSEWNAAGRWQGQADPPLSDLGSRQAAAAAHRLAAIGGAAAVVASDLQRAAKTAAIMADHLGLPSPRLYPDLRERDAGEFSGLTRHQIEARWPGWLAARRRPPGWEPDDRLLDRVVRGIGTVAADHPDGPVVIVTHGGVVYTLEEHLGAEHERLANLAARWVTVDGSRLVLGPRELLVDPDEAPVSVPRAL